MFSANWESLQKLTTREQSEGGPYERIFMIIFISCEKTRCFVYLHRNLIAIKKVVNKIL